MEQLVAPDLKTILHSGRASLHGLEYCRVLVDSGRVEYFKDEVILWQTFRQHCISQLTRSKVPDFMIDQLKAIPALFFVAFTAGQTDQEEGDQGMPANDETGRQAVNLPLRTFQPLWATEGSKFPWCALAS